MYMRARGLLILGTKPLLVARLNSALMKSNNTTKLKKVTLTFVGDEGDPINYSNRQRKRQRKYDDDTLEKIR